MPLAKATIVLLRVQKGLGASWGDGWGLGDTFDVERRIVSEPPPRFWGKIDPLIFEDKTPPILAMSNLCSPCTIICCTVFVHRPRFFLSPAENTLFLRQKIIFGLARHSLYIVAYKLVNHKGKNNVKL